MNLQFHFEYSFLVPFHEVDRAGIMFFAHIFTHAHETYEQFMLHLGLNLHRDWSQQKYLLPIVHAEADYKMPLHHGMLVKVHLNISKIGTTSFTTAYWFLDHAHQLCVNAELVHCCIDAKTHTAKTLPDELRMQFREL